MRSEFTNSKAAKTVAAILIAILVILVLAAFGGIEYKFDSTSVTAHTNMWIDKKIVFEEIESINMRKGIESGRRVSGFGSMKLKLGTFHNSEFGTYSLYMNIECDPVIVLQMKNRSVIVINDKDEAATEELFNEISSRLQK